MRDQDFFWLVGLLEGEGCFGIIPHTGGYRYPKVSLNMTDEDVVARAAILMDASYCRVKNRGAKDTYQIRIQGDSALNLMMKLKPHMGKRRQAKIVEILNTLDQKYLHKLTNLGRISNSAITEGWTKA